MTVSAKVPDTELDRVHAIIRAHPAAKAQLALLGDKRFLFSDDRSAFLMYGIHGRSWIALGDPVGPPEQAPALMRRFHGLCLANGVRPVFHEVSQPLLPHGLNLGLQAFHVADEGRIQLATFSLSGRKRHTLRNAVRSAGRHGRTFTWVPSISRDPALLPELRAVSDAWLGGKPAREKGFSIGRFDPDYLLRTDSSAGLVRQDGRLLAFVTVWAGDGKEEVYLDLMRCVPGAPHGTMDLLFVRLLQQAHRAGYTWFNIGMSPLPAPGRTSTGVRARLYRRARRWTRSFYNAEGLRQYKEKFGPQWSRRYLLAPGGLALASALTDLALLTSGSFGGIVGRVPRSLADNRLHRLSRALRLTSAAHGSGRNRD